MHIFIKLHIEETYKFDDKTKFAQAKNAYVYFLSGWYVELT